jgi:hypothetical protein
MSRISLVLLCLAAISLADCMCNNSGHTLSNQSVFSNQLILSNQSIFNMIIEFEQTGGFVGLTLKKVIDLDKLPPEDANKLNQLVEASDFFNLPEAIAASRPGVDRFHYTVTVNASGKKHTVDVDEAAIPPKLKPLIQQLTAAARKP